MKSDQHFTFMTKTLHDIERTEKVVPHLAKKSQNCSNTLEMERYMVKFGPEFGDPDLK